MNKKQIARHLYAQTELSKTQIANILGLHRATLSEWVRDGDWNRLKEAGRHLPSILAENCYHIIGQLTEHYLSESRMTSPVSHKEADTLYKLACTITKLKNRSVLNETMELMGFFLENIKSRDAALASRLAPYIEEYLAERAHIYTHNLMPQNRTAPGGRIPMPTEQQENGRHAERNADNHEAHFSDPEIIAIYKECNIPLPTQYIKPGKA